MADATLIVEHARVPLDDNAEGDGVPPISLEGGFCINGVEGEGHETFCLGPPGRDPDWSFCKTARKRYDLVVATILLRTRVLMGNDFKFSSDGIWNSDSEWIAAQRLYETIWPNTELNPEQVGIDYEEEEEI